MKGSERTDAIRLRVSGASYDAIRRQLGIAKSTLWRWLKADGLVETQPQRLTELRRIAQRKGAAAVRAKYLAATKAILERAGKEIGSISERDLCIHESATVDTARKFWSEALHVPPVRFRIRLKRHRLSPHRRHVGERYVGLVRVTVAKSAAFNRTIQGWIDGIVQGVGESANGKPSDFGSEYPGSIPGSPVFLAEPGIQRS